MLRDTQHPADFGLTHAEFSIMWALAHDRHLTHEDISSLLWPDPDTSPLTYTKVVAVHICRIRKKLCEAGLAEKYKIKTFRSSGYSLCIVGDDKDPALLHSMQYGKFTLHEYPNAFVLEEGEKKARFTKVEGVIFQALLSKPATSVVRFLEIKCKIWIPPKEAPDDYLRNISVYLSYVRQKLRQGGFAIQIEAVAGQGLRLLILPDLAPPPALASVSAPAPAMT